MMLNMESYTNKETQKSFESFKEILLNYEREISKNGRLYIHDIDSYVAGMHSCLTIPLKRVTGYLSTTVKHFNFAKQDEFKHRVKHIKN